MTLRSIVLTFAATCAASISLARAQCLDWRTFPTAGPYPTGEARAFVVHDDGTGAALYVGGDLHDPNAIAPAVQLGVLRWNGSALQNVTPLNAIVSALVSFDDGSGAALHAAADGRVLKWNGSSWQYLGLLTGVTTLAVHDDGSGAALYAGGTFAMAEGTPAHGVARWNGTAWSGLGAGPAVEPVSIYAMTSYDDGTGPALCVGGKFQSTASPNIAKWKSGAWSGVGSGANLDVRALVAWNDGSGPSLFAFGVFSFPGQHVARWDGSTWHSVGAGLTTFPTCARVVNDATGPRLFVGGQTSWLPVSPNTADVHAWNGSVWTAVNPGTQSTASCGGTANYRINAFAEFDEGAGPRLFAATSPGTLGSIKGVFSRSNGTSWEPVGLAGSGLNGSIQALHVHDDGSGPALYAGGSFCQADQVGTPIARWDGKTWGAIGTISLESVTALATYDWPPYHYLVASAYTSPPSSLGLHLWDGSAWSSTNALSTVYSTMQQFGSYLYLGGPFNLSSGYIARWRPGSQVGFVGAGANAPVRALTTYDDGTGLALYAGGLFTMMNNIGMARIARWNDTTWSPVGGGLNASVDALCVFNDGSGPALYAAGDFTNAGGVSAARVARWNGSSWSAVGAGFDAQVFSLGVFDDGSGPALYAGGEFTFSGTTSMRSIARWNGTSWTGVGGGISGAVRALCAHDDGTGLGPQLFVGGTFTQAGALKSDNFAAWRSCGGTISKFCFGDGSDGYCPCANQGLSGRGCNNSMLTGGARLNATGATNPDTIELYVAGELPNAATLVFQGTSALSSPQKFGGGLRCAGGTLVRLYTHNAVNGTVSVPAAGDPSISARSASQGDPLTPGAVRTYQAWYRDPVPNFCTPPAGNVWNLSNAVRIVW